MGKKYVSAKVREWSLKAPQLGEKEHVDANGEKASNGREDETMSNQRGKIVRVADYGLAFVSVGTGSQRRDYPFTFDKISRYRGESAKVLGLRQGTEVSFSETNGHVDSVEICATR